MICNVLKWGFKIMTQTAKQFVYPEPDNWPKCPDCRTVALTIVVWQVVEDEWAFYHYPQRGICEECGEDYCIEMEV